MPKFLKKPTPHQQRWDINKFSIEVSAFYLNLIYGAFKLVAEISQIIVH